MSQILYLQEGGSVPEQKMFKYHSGEIETDRLVKAIALNLDKYLENQNWSRKKKQRFVASVNRFIQGIENGNITEMSPTGSFTDTRGILGGGVSNTTGTKRFRDDQEGAAFIKWVLNAQDPYQKPAEPKKEKFNLNALFAKQFNKDIFHLDSDKLDVKALQSIQDSTELLKSIFTTLNNIDTDDWGAFGTKENYLAKVEEARQKIRQKATAQKGKLNKNDIVDPLIRLGMAPGFLDYLGNNKNNPRAKQTAAPVSTNNDDVWYNTNHKVYQLGNTIDSQAFTNGITQLNQNRSTFVPNFIQYFNTLNPQQYYQAVGDAYAIPWVSSDGATQRGGTNAFMMGNVMKDLISDSSQTHAIKIDNNTYALPSSITNDNGVQVITVYNPTYNTIQRIPLSYVSDNAAMKQYLGTNNSKIRWNKEGGVLKAQGGTTLFNSNISDLFHPKKKDQNLSFPSSNLNYDNFELEGNLFDAVESKGKWILSPAKPSTNKKVPSTPEYDSKGDATNLEKQEFYNYLTERLKKKPKESEAYFNKVLTLATPEHKQQIKSIIFKNGTYNHSAATEYLKEFAYDKELGILHSRPKLTGYRIIDGNGYRYGTRQELSALGYELDPTAKPKAIDENNPYIYAYTMKKKQAAPAVETSAPTPAALTEPAPTEPKKKPDPTRVDSAVGRKRRNNFLNRLKGAAPDIISFAGSMGRYFNNNNANKKLLEEALKQKPLEISPRRFERDIYGDYGALSEASDAASRILSSTAVPMTSNAKIEADRKLKALTAAEDARWKGQVANSTAIRQTHEAALAQARENAYNEVDTANANIRSRWANEEYKRNARMGYINQKAQNFNNLSQELQQQALNRITSKRQLEETALNQYLDAKYTNNPEMMALKTKYQDAVAKNDERLQQSLLQQMQQKALENNDARMIEFLKELSKIRGITLNSEYLKRGNGSATKVDQQNLKSGGRISDAARIKIAKIKDTLDRDKLFQKNISESNKENNKKLNSLSNTMQKLIMAVLK